MAKAKAASTKTAAAVKPPEELTRQYFDSLRKLQADAQRAVENAHRKLAAVPHELDVKARNSALEAVNSYVETIRSAIGQTDAGPRIEQGVRGYAVSLQKTAEGVHKDLADALQAYADAVKEVPENARRGIGAAYAEYVAELRDLMDDLDWDDLDPKRMAAVAQSMLAVAVYTAAGGGR